MCLQLGRESYGALFSELREDKDLFTKYENVTTFILMWIVQNSKVFILEVISHFLIIEHITIFM